MGAYSAHNQGVLQRRMGGRLGSSGNMVAVEIFTAVARGVFVWLDTQTKYDNQTGQLSNSIGVGVYENGTLVKWIDNPKRKVTNKSYTYHGTTFPFDGRKMLNDAINSAAGTTIGGYSMIIFCAAPYGEWVELGLGDQRADGSTKHGVGWWSEGLIPQAKSIFMTQCALHKLPTTSYRYGRA